MPLSRVAAAAVAGIALGLNRDLNGKPIGVRTLGIVSVAACMLAYAAIEFETDAGGGITGEMVGRAVQGLMAGIGFLGGGVILHTQNRSVEGLTTAAMVWLTTILGIACGLGAWHIAAIGVVVALLLVTLGGSLEAAIRRHLPDAGETQAADTPPSRVRRSSRRGAARPDRPE